LTGSRRSERARRTEETVRRWYAEADELPYHGLAHIAFVELAVELGADVELVEAAAWTHDLNYLVDRRSAAEDGADLRRQCLASAGFTAAEIERIQDIVVGASSEHHSREASVEAQALADADMLFKALPITPLLFARDYLVEGDRGLREMAHELIDRQRPLLAEDRYFYSATARRRYTAWAETNVRLWENVVDALDDPDVVALARQRLATEPDDTTG
jgi:uncharacterized protein